MTLSAKFIIRKKRIIVEISKKAPIRYRIVIEYDNIKNFEADNKSGKWTFELVKPPILLISEKPPPKKKAEWFNSGLDQCTGGQLFICRFHCLLFNNKRVRLQHQYQKLVNSDDTLKKKITEKIDIDPNNMGFESYQPPLPSPVQSNYTYCNTNDNSIQPLINTFTLDMLMYRNLNLIPQTNNQTKQNGPEDSYDINQQQNSFTWNQYSLQNQNSIPNQKSTTTDQNLISNQFPIPNQYSIYNQYSIPNQKSTDENTISNQYSTIGNLTNLTQSQCSPMNMYSTNNQTNLYSNGDDIFDLEDSYFTEYNKHDYNQENVNYDIFENTNKSHNQHSQDDIYDLEDSLFDQYTNAYEDSQYNTSHINTLENNTYNQMYVNNPWNGNSRDYQFDTGNNETYLNDDNSNLESFFSLYDNSNDIENKDQSDYYYDDSYILNDTLFSKMNTDDDQYFSNKMDVEPPPPTYDNYSYPTNDDSFLYDIYNIDYTDEENEDDTYNLRYFFDWHVDTK